MELNIYDAKTKLSQLVERAMAGEDVVIAKAGKPMVRLVPVQAPPARALGTAAGEIHYKKGWDSWSKGELDSILSRGPR
jgi:prevent-host-death family protein